jgi:hypothetical protein
MPQSDGRNKLKRMEIEYNGQTYKFNINPEEYTQDEPSRSTVTQTKGGAWIDDFGGGLQNIFIKGTTGFKKGLGVEKFKELRGLIRKYYEEGNAGDKVTKDLVFHNYTDEESWVVHTDPGGFKLLRSKSNPLLYMYEMRFVCLRPAQYPGPKSVKASGGVSKTVGTPSKIKSVTSEKYIKEVGRNYIMHNLAMTDGSPPSSLTAMISSLNVMGDGSLRDFGVNVSQPTMSMMSLSTPSIEEKSFEASISSLSEDKLDQIKNKKVDTLSTNVDSESFLGKVIDLENRFIPNDLKVGMKAVLLELLSLTQHMNDENVKSKITKGDVVRLKNNIRWLANKFHEQGNSELYIVNELRWLERSVSYIIYSDLFNKNYVDEYNIVNNVID